MFDIQPATPDHAVAIQAVKDAVWPDDATSESYIRSILAEPDHQAHVAIMAGTPAGFVSGFLTLSTTGARRWEVDLLAVHPDFRRRGIATELIRASVQTGIALGADEFRALIHVNNIGSQTAFLNCGFQDSKEICALYVSANTAEAENTVIDGLHLIPVNTLNYCGVWLEGQVDATGLQLAQAIRTRYEWDVAGAVLALSEPDLISAAESLGYSRIGDYTRWQKF